MKKLLVLVGVILSGETCANDLKNSKALSDGFSIDNARVECESDKEIQKLIQQYDSSIVNNALIDSCIGRKIDTLDDSRFIELQKKLIVQNFKDPESAKFRNGFLMKTKSMGKAYCVEVNAKNSFGAYIGYVPFIASGVNIHTLDENRPELIKYDWEAYCWPDSKNR